MIDIQLVKALPQGNVFRSTTGLAEDGRISLMAAMAACEFDRMLQEARGSTVTHLPPREIAKLSQLLKEAIGDGGPSVSPLLSDPFGLHVLISFLGDMDPPPVVTTALEVVEHIATFAKQLAVTVSIDVQKADVVLLRRLMESCISLSQHSRRACDAFKAFRYGPYGHSDRNRW